MASGPAHVPSSQRRLLLAIPTAALSADAGLAFHGAFDLGDIAVLCLLAAALPAAVLAAGAWFRSRRGPRAISRPAASLAISLGGALAAWIVLLPSAAIWQARSHGGDVRSPSAFLSVLGSALHDGPRQLLATTPPALPTAVLLTTLGTFVWWASVWVTASALRGSAPLLTILPAGILFALGTSASAGAGNPDILQTAGAFVIIALFYLGFEQSTREQPADTIVSGGAGRGSRFGSIVGLVPLFAGIAAVALGAVAVAPHLPGLAQRQPWDPRSLIPHPASVSDDTDPLTQAVAWLKDGTRTPLLTVTTDAPDQPLRWLVLDGYDGRHWSSSAAYEPAGKTMPSGDALAAPPWPSTPVHDTVQLTTLPGPYLPAPGRVHSVSGTAVRVDAQLGMIATGDGNAAGRLTYGVDTTDPVFTDQARLRAAAAGSGGALDAQRELPPGIPDDITGFAAQSAIGADPYDQMTALAAAVKSAFGYDPNAAAGQSYGRLNSVLISTDTAAGQRGAASVDVFATLFALAARDSGYPSRVVVGFVPGTRVGSQTYQVTGADVRVWPEVYFSGVGWVPFYDAVPDGKSTGVAGVAPLPARPTGSVSANASSSGASDALLSGGPSVDIHNPKPGRSAISVLLTVVEALVGILAGSLLVYLVTVTVVRRRRRATHRADPDPRRRTQWAWLESLEALGIGTALTPQEVAQTAPGMLGTDGAEPVRRLAGLAEIAAYALDPPGAAEADEAWACAERIRVLSRSRTPRHRRAVGLLRPPSRSGRH